MNEEKCKEIAAEIEEAFEMFKENHIRPLAKAMCGAFKEAEDAIRKLIEPLDFSNQNFKHDWHMATYAKKKRTRKKYAKKCIK